MIAEPTTLRVWDHDAVHWTETLCDAPRCLNPADGLWEHDDDRRRGVPVCVDCAERLLERWVAASVIERRRVGDLPELWERPPRRRPVHIGHEAWDRSPELWLREQGYYGDEAREDPDWDIPF